MISIFHCKYSKPQTKTQPPCNIQFIFNCTSNEPKPYFRFHEFPLEMSSQIPRKTFENVLQSLIESKLKTQTTEFRQKLFPWEIVWGNAMSDAIKLKDRRWIWNFWEFLVALNNFNFIFVLSIHKYLSNDLRKFIENFLQRFTGFNIDIKISSFAFSNWGQRGRVKKLFCYIERKSFSLASYFRVERWAGSSFCY